MTKSPIGSARSMSKKLLVASSTIALLTSAQAHAQQIINDGDNITVTSAADGESITAAPGVTSIVDGAPVVIVNNTDVTLDNAGTLRTTGVTQTVQVNTGTTGAIINNAATGVLEADSRVVNFDGSDATLNNDGVIRGTGSQRNGAVYANRTSNNIAINNSATGLIDAGVEGAAIAIEIGGGGAARSGSIVNAGIVQGRGQAAPTGGTAGDGLRFFGPGLAPAYVYDGNITNSGTIASESNQGTVAGIRFANRIGFQGTLENQAGGTISGAQNGLYFGNDADHAGGIVNNAGTISSDSRALNIDGTGLVVNNLEGGQILGTGNQRNGTVYADSTAQDFVLNNDGTIDAGAGLEGAGFSVELSAAGNAFDINNTGTVQGRGNAGAGLTTAGDGLRFERTRNAGALDGSSAGLFTGNITNSGTIDSEAANGTAAGIRFVNGVSFSGTIDNQAGGTISGVQNGLYFGNATPAGGGDFTGAVVNNAGTISSDSRALNIDGTGLVVNNLEGGQILGTGNQRNGTVYADSTAQDFVLNNDGTIDAGDGNEGAGFSVELSEAGNAFDINNTGTVQGRGTAAAGLATAGDGLRLERTRNAGVLDGTSSGLFTGNITNSGLIDSEGDSGTTSGIRFVNGVSFNGTIDNQAGGTISGVQNGLYFGNATPAGGGDFTGAVVNNAGTISSGSRALNIDGTGLVVNNTGSILGTDNQRNGTVYADSTAQDFVLNNDGTIDAGAGNEGAGFSVELSAAGNAFDINNTGTVQGRGTAAAGLATAGDGLRFERTRNAGVLDGTSEGLFTGNITNSGLINSEGDSGTTAGIRFVNGVSFSGTIDNQAGGTISGVQNGLYFGNATSAGGGDFTGAVVNNAGTISSGSRALNIDGTGLVVNNTGSILGTGAQRNGTVYADGTANNFALNNSGTIDAGVAGSGVSFQLGTTDGDVRSFTLVNGGTIAGRGDALPSGASAGLRLFNGAGAGTTVTVADDIVNNATISSETGPALLIENIAFTGDFLNNGTLTGPIAVDASSALSGLNFVQNGGAISGDFVGSAQVDNLTFAGGTSLLEGDVTGNVAVNVATPASVTVSGARSLEGSLSVDGTLAFDLGVDSLAVDGDTSFAAGSTVNITTSQTSADLVLNAPIAVLTETGTFTDNGVTVNVTDDDFLIDYQVDLGSITVTPTATDLSNVSADANISGFGSAITSAVANGRLPGAVFDGLNAATSTAEFEATALTVLPAINDGIAREIFETQRFASSLLTDRLAGEETGIWGQIFYRNADRDADSLSALGYDADTIGFTLGLDKRLSETATVGVLLNYADIDIDANGLAGAQSDVNSYQISAYAGLDFGSAFVNAELGYSFNDVESSRVAVGAPITSESDADGVIASLSTGYALETGSFTLTPSAGLRYASLSQDSFTETGGLGLTLDTDSNEFLEATLGLRIAGKADESKDLSVVPFANIAYSYDLIGDGVGVNGSFNGGLDSFRLTAGESSQSRFDLGAGLNLVNKNGLSIGAEYQGRFASDYQSHSGGVKVRFEF
ncbi:outer membrane autotransporter barrel domain-containing protein [Parasphingorhabdus marina DSM 22363]|uniref:Outer membrane autotransporter barrel domain-containing protein n=1 Tax=Parasphingorhabdus marina DSM 22363 TaxID=1123272 RepID=A0A1N6D323_9SPHN|nr:autotransporter outer membrane beta-barrel domain-containing protein [Parasphingorhabdus marina]SIN65106.1 outer membrane autotransporter barrel domain-containing protein [Parasphingorhabdus marina DSM 22363]